jgi:hypothetical protein
MVAAITKDQTELTPDQEAVCDEYYRRGINVLNVPRETNRDAAIQYAKLLYSVSELTVPDSFVFARSPYEALKLAERWEGKGTGKRETFLDSNGIYYLDWVMRDLAWAALGVLGPEDADLVQTHEAMAKGLLSVWDTIMLDDYCVIVQFPKKLALDTDGNMHCADGPCIEWLDGEVDYAWHGTWVDARVIVDTGAIDRAYLQTLTNTEERRAVGEILGWSRFAEIMGATSVSLWVDFDTGLSYELLRYDGGKLLRKLSPVLSDGTQPTYLEPVHEDLVTAQAARKWQATGLSVDECEQDPSLTYGSES